MIRILTLKGALGAPSSVLHSTFVDTADVEHMIMTKDYY